MDLYTLYRILTKKYIKLPIIYAGNRHIHNYLVNLVHTFNFKITHADYIENGII